VPLLKLAALFHDVAKPDTFLMKEGEVHFYGHDSKGAKIVENLGYKRLKLSRPEVSMLKKLVKEHMRPHLLATSQELTDRALRRFMRDLGEDFFGCMMIAWADGFATGGKTRHLEEAFRKMIEIKHQDDAKPKVERLVNGFDLIAQGVKPGPIFKPILQELLDRQLEGKITTKEEGLEAAKEIYANLQKKNKS
jgi:poly(A) polymerase